MKEMDIQPCIHILDCTKVLVNLDNENYENSSVVKIDGETMRGYKLGVLRGILDDSGIAEDYSLHRLFNPGDRRERVCMVKISFRETPERGYKAFIGTGVQTDRGI